MLVETALLKLGTAAVRTAAKLWLADDKIAAEVGASAVDLVSERFGSQRDKRRFARMVETFAEAVVDRLEPIIDTEFAGLPEHERTAAVLAVQDTFEQAALVDKDLFAADLDARHLDRALRRQAPGHDALLATDAKVLYELLLRESCGYVIEIARGLPTFSTAALTELLKRDTEIINGIREVLARLPQRDRGAGFDYDYRQQVARKLDYVELFGVTLDDASRRYPLSVAYISLTADTEDGRPARVEELLARSNKLFIRGEAGLGKTTLLHWIAVRSARRDFPDTLAAWNNTIPFFVPLRRYADRELPTPERFLDEVGRHIADEMPKGWVQQHLRGGHAVVLIDGVDELAPTRREEARDWLRYLTLSFPEARWVITSRPGAAQPDWLATDGFLSLDLQPMTPADVRTFVQRWHAAMQSMCADDEAKREIESYHQNLRTQLDTRNHLRRLAGYPLLCALLCALHKDRRAALPDNRMELYEVALHMLLERRDAERRLPSPPGLNRTEKTLLLGDLAYWLIRNERSDIETDRAIEHLGRRLNSMAQVQAGAEEVYRHLLVRSGLLREQVEGRVDFVHRTFQEYLAARSAMQDFDDVDLLLKNASSWHEVFVLAVGHASSHQREALLTGLTATKGKRNLQLLALACLETAPDLNAELRAEIKRQAADLVPPKSRTQARVFASAGAFALDLLANANPGTDKEMVATIRALAETELPEAIPLLARFAEAKGTARRELLAAWDRFDRDEYARVVLAEHQTVLLVQDVDPALRHLRGLRRLYVSKGGDLRYVPPGVRELVVTGPTELSTLPALPKLRMLRLSRIEDISDLSPLRAAPRLEYLILDPNGSPANLDVATLLAMKALRRLEITCADSTVLGGPLYDRAELQVIWRPRNDDRPADPEDPRGDRKTQ
ncbi:NACHT domain-containing protein [Crossiella cryophila]|uniref:NACHT domain-containing protein n=1 Tax=Crossiella cryophila TaxID=43355 RepID=A0A7W7FTA3_9PSEU|nr:NACHT domain-containing protein [Crossiella cryophila]MBB4674589.1 hypothetical protein [Crossiella cryophila]